MYLYIYVEDKSFKKNRKGNILNVIDLVKIGIEDIWLRKVMKFSFLERYLK